LFIKKGDRQDNKSLDFSGLKREKNFIQSRKAFSKLMFQFEIESDSFHLVEIKLAKNQVLFINLLYLTKFAVIAF
jgi:hypothetical protein